MPHKDIAIHIERVTVSYTDVISGLVTPRSSLVSLFTFPSSQCVVYGVVGNIKTIFGDNPSYALSSFKDIGYAVGNAALNYDEESVRQSLFPVGLKTNWGTNKSLDNISSLYGVETLKMFVDCAVTDSELSNLTQGEIIINIAYGDMTMA